MWPISPLAETLAIRELRVRSLNRLRPRQSWSFLHHVDGAVNTLVHQPRRSLALLTFFGIHACGAVCTAAEHELRNNSWHPRLPAAINNNMSTARGGKSFFAARDFRPN